MENNEHALKLLAQGYEKILQGLTALGYDTDDENFRETALRSAKGFHELVNDRTAAAAQIEAMLEKTFPAKYKEMVISKHNVAFGVCPHHLLPVIYRISLAYIPTEKVLGLSKLTRIARLMSQAPILQEDLTHDLCRLLDERLKCQGAAVYIEGLHLCMASRGARAHEARLVTSAVRGDFLENPATRGEFIKLVTAAHPALL